MHITSIRCLGFGFLLALTSAVSAQAPPETLPLQKEPEVAPSGALEPLDILGAQVPPGEVRRLSWQAGFGYGLTDTATPVLVAHGHKPGPTLCLTAAIHGDELNGIEIVRRLLNTLDPSELSGTVIGVPIVNVPGFQRRSRYLPDRRDLNRAFPGDPAGSLAARVAHDFFHEIVLHCGYLVDIHTGSFYRSNLPQLRANLRRPEVVDMTKGFGAISVLHSAAAAGTLRRAAVEAKIPAVTFEVGEPNRLQAKDVALAVRGIQTLLSGLKMTATPFSWSRPQPVFYESRWVRVDRGGILFTAVSLGQSIKAGDVLGTVTDPLSNVYTEVKASHSGRVLGKALNQFVMPGFAAFRIGIETDEEQLVEEAAEQVQPESDAATPANTQVEDRPPS